MLHWLAHVTGVDTQQSYFYDFWSGIGTQLTVLLAGAGAYHKHQCSRPRCWRVGKHTRDGSAWCIRHRPTPDEGADPRA